MNNHFIESEKLIKLNEKSQNTINILNCILDKEQISYNEIAVDTKLSLSTISRVIAVLKAKNIIINRGKDTTTLGRRPELVSFNNNYGIVMHFNILAGCIKGFCLDLNGKVLDEYEDVFDSETSLEEIILFLKNVYEKLVKRNKGNNRKLLAVCVSVPGIVNEKERLIYKLPDIPQLIGTKAFSLIENIFNVPVIIKRCTELSAIGERIGAFSNYENLVYIDITNSSSIGAGIIINGKIYKGSNNFAGEIGDMLFGKDHFNNYKYDNNSGFLENMSSLNVLYLNLINAMNNGKAKTLKKIMEKMQVDKLTLNIIEEAIEELDYDVWDIYSEILKIWAISIINIYCLIDPDVVILGGIVNETNKVTLQQLNRYISIGLNHETKICLNMIGNKALLIGGSYFLKQYVLNKIILNQVTE